MLTIILHDKGSLLYDKNVFLYTERKINEIIRPHLIISIVKGLEWECILIIKSYLPVAPSCYEDGVGILIAILT